MFWLFVLFFCAMGFGFAAPYAIKETHMRRQNDLLGRCRALFLLALQAFELKNERAARSCLVRIRRVEARWRYGNSRIFRFALAAWAISIGAAGFFVLRGLAILALDWHTPTMDDVRRLAVLIPILDVWVVLWSATALSGEWTSPWIVDDCGDRLQRLLDSEHSDVEVDAELSEFDQDAPILGGLTPRQIFGLAPGFTRRQLDRARRRLVTHLHPVLAYGEAPEVRRAREEALKRVNAAYDRLRALAAAS